MKTKHIFWGTLFSAIGILFLLNNLDAIDYNLNFLVKYWPGFIILLGIALLSKGSLFKNIFTGLAAILLALSIFAGVNSASLFFNDNFYDVDTKDVTVDGNNYNYSKFSEEYSPNIKKATFNFKAGGGSFKIINKTDKLFILNSEGIKYFYTYNNDNTENVAIKFTSENKKIRWFKKGARNWTIIKLNSNPMWNFDFELGASSMDFDLRQFKIGNLNIDMGAAALELNLGKPIKNTYINIEAGASSIDVTVPKSAACQIKTDISLSSKNFIGFNKIRNSLYRTNNFDQIPYKIFIDISSGVSSITVKRK